MFETNLSKQINSCFQTSVCEIDHLFRKRNWTEFIEEWNVVKSNQWKAENGLQENQCSCDSLPCQRMDRPEVTEKQPDSLTNTFFFPEKRNLKEWMMAGHSRKLCSHHTKKKCTETGNHASWWFTFGQIHICRNHLLCFSTFCRETIIWINESLQLLSFFFAEWDLNVYSATIPQHPTDAKISDAKQRCCSERCSKKRTAGLCCFLILKTSFICF